MNYKIFEKVIVPDDVELYFIGDIHGNRKDFEKKLKDYGVREQDHVVMSGDIADRGDEIVPLFFDFLNKPNYHMSMGNHEDFMLNYESKAEFENWLTTNNGGDKTFAQMGREGLKYFAKEIIKKVPLILEVHHRGKVFGVVHAGIPFFYDPDPVCHWPDIIKKAKKDPEYAYYLMWDRSVISRVAEDMYNNVNLDQMNKSLEFRESLLNNPEGIYKVTPDMLNPYMNNNIPAITGVDYVIHGHTGVFAPTQYENMLWIDTKFCTGYFTLLNFNNEKDKWDAYFYDKEL